MTEKVMRENSACYIGSNGIITDQSHLKAVAKSLGHSANKQWLFCVLRSWGYSLNLALWLNWRGGGHSAVILIINLAIRVIVVGY